MHRKSIPTPKADNLKDNPWLVRIGEIFSSSKNDIIAALNPITHTPLGKEYHLLNLPQPNLLHNSPAAPFFRWNMPVQHAWPCNPRTMDHFIERGAQSITNKFSTLSPQSILVGQLDAGTRDKSLKILARNLRGRLLQLFPPLNVRDDVEQQDPDKPTLFCLLGRQGLFAGMQSPRLSQGFHPGGTKFIRMDADTTVSRAGAKIAEALHHMLLYRPLPPTGASWLELGASPGGMSSELLQRGFVVTAIDRASMDPSLDNHPGLCFINTDVASYRPSEDTRFNALLCDMNGPMTESFQQVIRLSRCITPQGLIIFTLKGHGTNITNDLLAGVNKVASLSRNAGLKLLAARHLSYNRKELTLFLLKK